MLARARFDVVFQALRFLGPEFEKRLGFTVQQLEAFIVALCSSRLHQCLQSMRTRYQMLNVGYFVIMTSEIEGLLDRLALPYYATCHLRFGFSTTEAEAKGEVMAIMNALTYTEQACYSVDLWDRRPARLFIPLPMGVVCDLAAIPSVLQHLVADFSSLSGDVGSEKGDCFELEVMKLASEHDLTLWECQKMLRCECGDRQIDVSVVKGKTLFILECKATGMNPLTLRGEIRRLDERWDEMVKHCDQASSLAAFLSENRSGHNYALPDNVTQIEWAVVVPGAEWIPTAEEHFWFTDSVPRICAPEEILRLMDGWE